MLLAYDTILIDRTERDEQNGIFGVRSFQKQEDDADSWISGPLASMETAN